MGTSKKILSVLFFIALGFEFLFNQLVFAALIYQQVNRIVVFTDFGVLIVGCLLSLIFGLRSKWGKAAIASLAMGIAKLCFAYYYLSLEMDSPLFFKNHLHIIVPAIFAVILWRICVAEKKRAEDTAFAKQHEGKI